MFNLVEKRRWYFLLSALIIVPGLLIMIYSWATTGRPFRLSIDFAGGSIYDLAFQGAEVTESQIRDVFAANGDENVIIQQLGQPTPRWLVSNVTIDAENREDATTVVEATAAGSAIADAVSVEERNGNFIIRVDGSDVTDATVRDALAAFITEATTLEQVMFSGWSVRGSFQEEATVNQLLADLNELAPIDRNAFRSETISSTVGAEVTRAALIAVLVAAIVITSFIVIAFRQVPNAFRYGVCAIAAMLHDILVVMGVMSLMGLLLGWEVDALFLTAVLTVVGFSVQDSIVVFDRIRENIPLRIGEPYETIVNRSLWETMHRSLATQLNAFFIMFAILLFGGDTIRQFIFILFIGLLTGSYSSLFTAVPMLVSWEKGEIPFVNQPELDAEAA
jgi:preprotein translocase subunit SecF